MNDKLRLPGWRNALYWIYDQDAQRAECWWGDPRFPASVRLTWITKEAMLNSSVPVLEMWAEEVIKKFR